MNCPICNSDNVLEIICSGNCRDWNDGAEKASKLLDKYPIRPSERFKCEDCRYTWDNPEYEKYLMIRAMG